MRILAKRTVAAMASVLGWMQCYRFPSYFTGRDRLRTLLFGIEPDVCRFINRNVQRGATVLDIGGNVGLICRAFARRVGAQGTVWTFEPDPYTRDFLEYNVSRSQNIFVSPLAISDMDGSARLHLHPMSGTGNSLLDIPEDCETVEVLCSTLDSFLSDKSQLQPDVLKIDVEGAEPRVFSGMVETIARYRNLLIITEFCPANLANGGYTPQEFFSQIVSVGLCVSIILRNGSTRPIADCKELLYIMENEAYCNLLCRHRAVPAT